MTATTISIIPPPRPTDTNEFRKPTVQKDALFIRNKVFVDEQGVNADTEIDEDDSRSWHWVIYEQQNPNQNEQQEKEKYPVGVIRLVPPPHEPHEVLLNSMQQPPSEPKSNNKSIMSIAKYDFNHEPYIKLTRVAILKEYRGCGLARKLVDVALHWAIEHSDEIDAAYRRVLKIEGEEEGFKYKSKWNGLVLVHAQIDVEKMYERMGFRTDPNLGRWMEEGIEHVGMWRRITK